MKIGRNLMALIVLLGIIPWRVSVRAQASEMVYYVDPGGSDASGDGSLEKPWASLSHACEQVKDFGDTIYINAGTYTDDVQCVLSRGVRIQGAGKSSVRIDTAASRYISTVSNVPTVDGSNEISGVSIYGNDSNTAIYSQGRNNQRIHDNHFESLGKAIDIRGKTPLTSWSLGDCDGTETDTAFFCDNDKTLSNEPASTDWATGIEIYNNSIVNAKIYPQTIMGAEIHHNDIDNSGSLKSGVGNTTLWWNNVAFHDNTITMKTIAWSTIALEVWMVEGDSRFYNNATNGWFSILANPNGPDQPWSYEILDNTFASDVPRGIGSDAVSVALEACFYVENVLIEGNYFTNTGENNTYFQGIGIWGHGVNRNFHIRKNVFYNLGGNGIEINSNDTRNEQYFDGDDFFIYNNVFDTMGHGSKGAVIIGDGPGDIDGIILKNNLFLNVSYGVVFWPEPDSISANEFMYNVLHGVQGSVQSGGLSSFEVSDNYTFDPDITRSGTRPDPYYQPIDGNANIVDAGVDVGLAYSGSAPDIGAYEILQSNQYYVSLEGDDGYPGTIDQPWRTIQKAADSLQAGDTVYIREGVYKEQVRVHVSGAPGSPITFHNYPGETVIIDGENTLPALDYEGLIHIEGQDDLQWMGLTVRNSNSFGIKVVGSSERVLLRDCEVAHTLDGGIVFQAYEGSPTDVTVDGCEVHDTNERGPYAVHEAISMDGVDTFEIMNNYVYNNGEEGIDAKVGSTNGKIHHNIVHDNNGPNIYVDAANTISIYNNEVYGTGGIKSGVMLGVESYSGQPLTYDIKIYNNLIYDNDSGIGFWIDSNAVDYASIADVEILHNTIHSNEDNGGLWIINAPDDDYTNIIVRNNIFWDNDLNGHQEIRDSTSSRQFNNFTIDHNLFREGAVSDTYGEQSVQTSDVHFVNGAQNDYHLLPASAAVDEGISTGIAEDFDGQPRPQGAEPDIGAFEALIGEPTFDDVPFDHPYYDYIELIYQGGYVAGCSTDPLMYCPERIMNRAESSVFVERGIHGAEYDPLDPMVVVFDDVALDAWYADWVHGLWDDGYTAGCGTDPLIYCPDQEHTRAEGCVFYLRVMYGADYEPGAAKGYFVDVDPEMWYAKWVDAAWEAGIAEACEAEPELRFCPEEGLTRAVAAYMMVQAKQIEAP